MLEELKLLLRIDNDEFNAEIQALIETAQADLLTSGVSTSSINDKALCRQAIYFYVKANFGYDNDDREAFNSAYDMLKAKCAILYTESEA